MMTLWLLDALVLVICLSLALLLYKLTRASQGCQEALSKGYILKNQVTHARLLPKEASHAFTYPTISFLVSLDALERHQLDLVRGWLFGYGGRWGRLTGLRAAPYLTNGAQSIKGKLEGILQAREHVNRRLEDAWMMTMPSFMGFEGINPLTVYFCYDGEDELWLTILEIHNTFGESHVHVLEVNQGEDPQKANGYDHQWTFPRQFHVSPFNDRSGYYTVSIKRPSHPPTHHHDEVLAPPKPSVRVHQYTSSENNPDKRGELKLTALLRPTRATPLTAYSLLFALAHAPFALLFTFPRILYVAGILHYVKRLDVYLRPDPLPDWNGKPAGVKWLEEGFIERFARIRVSSFLERRSQQMGTSVILVSADPRVPRLVFGHAQQTSSELTIRYTSPRFFSILFLCPSAGHALLLGCDTENIFQVSDREHFLAIFSSPAGDATPSRPQRLRCRDIPPSLPLPIPAAHFLDSKSDVAGGLMVLTSLALGQMEKWIFRMARARIVEGQEPWRQWERATLRKGGFASSFVTPTAIGSVRR